MSIIVLMLFKFYQVRNQDHDPDNLVGLWICDHFFGSGSALENQLDPDPDADPVPASQNSGMTLKLVKNYLMKSLL